MTKTQDRSSRLPPEEHTSMTSGNPQGSLQDAYPDHSHGTGPDSNIPYCNSKTPNETETKIRRLDENASAPSATSQQGRECPVNPERHQNTRSQHHQGHSHRKGTKGHRAKPNPPRHWSNQIPPATLLFSLWTRPSHRQLPNLQEEKGIPRLLEVAATGQRKDRRQQSNLSSVPQTWIHHLSLPPTHRRESWKRVPTFFQWPLRHHHQPEGWKQKHSSTRREKNLQHQAC